MKLDDLNLEELQGLVSDLSALQAAAERLVELGMNPVFDLTPGCEAIIRPGFTMPGLNADPVMEMPRMTAAQYDRALGLPRQHIDGAPIEVWSPPSPAEAAPAATEGERDVSEASPDLGGGPKIRAAQGDDPEDAAAGGEYPAAAEPEEVPAFLQAVVPVGTVPEASETILAEKAPTPTTVRIAPRPAPAPEAVPDTAPLTPQGELARHVAQLPRVKGWTLQRDHHVLHFAALGWPVNDIALELVIPAAEVKSRFQLLTGGRTWTRAEVLAELAAQLGEAAA